MNFAETELHLDLLFTPTNLKPVRLRRDIFGLVTTMADGVAIREVRIAAV